MDGDEKGLGWTRGGNRILVLVLVLVMFKLGWGIDRTSAARDGEHCIKLEGICPALMTERVREER